MNSAELSQSSANFWLTWKVEISTFYLVLVTDASVIAIFGSNSVRVRPNSAGVQLGMSPEVSGNVSMVSWNTSEA